MESVTDPDPVTNDDVLAQCQLMNISVPESKKECIKQVRRIKNTADQKPAMFNNPVSNKLTCFIVDKVPNALKIHYRPVIEHEDIINKDHLEDLLTNTIIEGGMADYLKLILDEIKNRLAKLADDIPHLVKKSIEHDRVECYRLLFEYVTQNKPKSNQDVYDTHQQPRPRKMGVSTILEDGLEQFFDVFLDYYPSDPEGSCRTYAGDPGKSENYFHVSTPKPIIGAFHVGIRNNEVKMVIDLAHHCKIRSNKLIQEIKRRMRVNNCELTEEQEEHLLLCSI